MARLLVRTFLTLLTVPFFVSCLVDSHCLSNADCPSEKTCNAEGSCVYQCEDDADCGEGFVCTAHRCMASETPGLVCPDDMVAVAGAFCVDRFEASRPDASAEDRGTDESEAKSRAGVLPWEVGEDNALASQACEAAGKRLCSSFEWEAACRGSDLTAYGYGTSYEPETCNGLDTYGTTDYHLMPTDAFPGCHNDWGAVDMNGNLWEHVAEGDGTRVRGGAYNCIDSMTLHR